MLRVSGPARVAWMIGAAVGCATPLEPESVGDGESPSAAAGGKASGSAGRESFVGGSAGRGSAGSGSAAIGARAGSGGVSSPPAIGPLEVVFKPPGGTFMSSLSVTLEVGNTAAKVHYTLNGSVPSGTSPVYDKPIDLQQSTRLRAVAIVPTPSGQAAVGGGADNPSGPIGAASYLRVAANAADFASHLPIVVIDTFEGGALDPQGKVFVPATLQVFEPASTSPGLVRQANLDTRIGIHVRGESSRGFPKKQYAVELWDGQNEDLDLPLLGMPAASDWIISDPIAMDRTLIRNAFVYELSNSIGRYAPRTRFVEVFLVAGLGDLTQANFLGFFTVIEKIKRGAGRLEIAKLEADDLVEPSVTGGYIVRIDPGLPDFLAISKKVQFAYPDSELMLLPERLPQVNYIRNFIDSYGLAASALDFKHPSTRQHYSEFIEQDAWIDHHIINALTKNPDALRRSTYFHKDRGGRLVAGPVWDFDRTLGTPYDERAIEPERWGVSFSDAWWKPLFNDPAFRARYRERFLRLMQKEFAPAILDPMIDKLALTVGAAAPRNYARWPENPPQVGGQAAEIAIMKTFLKRRMAWIKTQLNLPDFRVEPELPSENDSDR